MTTLSDSRMHQTAFSYLGMGFSVEETVRNVLGILQTTFLYGEPSPGHFCEVIVCGDRVVYMAYANLCVQRVSASVLDEHMF